jgi:secretion/DNA translocation related TadE-like protein
VSRDERGAATLLVLAGVTVVLFVGVALAGVAGVVHAHRVAQAAADLTALAAAGASGSGCAGAAEVAVANGAVLVGCLEEPGARVRVSVRVSGPALAGRPVDVVAEARAGPG